MLKRRLRSFNFAFKGVSDLFKSQANARIHLLLAALALAAGFFFHLSNTEWLALILTIGMVMAAEAFNTSLEYLTDLASPEFHPLAGKAKDAAAAGVLITAASAVFIGLVLFLPKLLAFF